MSSILPLATTPPNLNYFLSSTTTTMPIAQPQLRLRGSVVNEGTLFLEKVIGLGSYGKIYRAVETDSAVSSRRSSWASSSTSSSSPSPEPKVYAVKCLRRPQSFQADHKLYDYERALHSSVSSHPNIITLHDTFIEQGHMFFVLDMAVHDTMLEAIRDGMYQHNTPLLKRVFGQLIDAVQFCHRKGVYHRNIKPDHILVDYWGGNPCITDFGLATTDTVSYQLGVGTAPYMTPESFEDSAGGSYRPELSDAWAIGMTLMVAVTNGTPWYSARPKVFQNLRRK
ncbi:kinase-like domain-containing protein [Roridomyces roridus]|uniref:non-specific serine/threonine protein kinase n=1 Tax=Roridomyces roridus TaxID=1738132 RepID=A0AAD7CIW6_9AGAR|nr:kinase-like domain-containing protein [Roridomyces roridus]